MNDLELAKIERRIYSIRGVRVILDADLAVLYGVSTKRLNEQVRRNRKRFPDDFAFQLSAEETAALRCKMRPQVRMAADVIAPTRSPSMAHCKPRTCSTVQAPST